MLLNLLLVAVLFASMLNIAQCGLPSISFIPELESRLKEDRNNNNYSYDTTVRPNAFGNLVIFGQFTFSGVFYVDVRSSWVGIQGSLQLAWQDDRLKWSPDDFGGIHVLPIAPSKIWLPTLMHSGGKTLSGSVHAQKASVDSTGYVTATYIFSDYTPCPFDMTNFPHDSQKCTVRLTSVDPKMQLRASSMRVPQIGMDWADSVHYGAWMIDHVTFGSPQGLTSMFTLEIKMTRIATFYIKAYISPICLILLLVPMIFLLPPDSPEKLTYGAILLLSMIYASDKVDAIYPAYSTKIPRLVQLNIAAASLLFLCILLTSLISSFERIGRGRPLPAWAKKHILGRIGPMLCVKEDVTSNSRGSIHIKTSNGANESDSAVIIQNEQSIDFQEETFDQPVTNSSQVNHNVDPMETLVTELRRSRLITRTQEVWSNFFTVINRLLFIITLFIAIVIIICFLA